MFVKDCKVVSLNYEGLVIIMNVRIRLPLIEYAGIREVLEISMWISTIYPQKKAVKQTSQVKIKVLVTAPPPVFTEF